MDGAIADFDQELLQRWQKHHPDPFYVPIEQRTTFYVRTYNLHTNKRRAACQTWKDVLLNSPRV